MKEHGRAFQCEPCRRARASEEAMLGRGRLPRTIAAPCCPPIAPGTMPRVNRANARTARADDTAALLPVV
jgi:hypothetical protein